MNSVINMVGDTIKDILKIKIIIRPILVVILLLGLLAACDFIPTSQNFDDLLPGIEDILSSTQTDVPVEPVDTVIPEDSEVDTEIPEDGENESDSYVSVKAEYIFQNQPGSPVSISSWIHDCNWTGIAGQVFYESEKPVDNIVVEAGGELAGVPIVEVSITGTNPDYGLEGYEIQLSDHTVDSSGTVWVQLKDIEGLDLSPKIYIDTHNDCAQNLTILNFVNYETLPVSFNYVPLISR